MTDELGCQTSSDIQIESLSIEDKENSYISIFPNPSEDIINIYSDNSIMNTINMYTIEGKLINQYMVNNNEFNINRDNLANGQYIIDINIKDKSIKKQIIIK